MEGRALQAEKSKSEGERLLESSCCGRCPEGTGQRDSWQSWKEGTGLRSPRLRCYTQGFALSGGDGPGKSRAQRMAWTDLLSRKSTLAAAWKPRGKEASELEAGVTEQCEVGVAVGLAGEGVL